LQLARERGLSIGPNSDYIWVYGKGCRMKLSSNVKPISKLKAEAPAVIRGIAASRAPVIITVNGEAKAVLQDIASYEETQEAMALLKILALANKQVEEGKVRPARVAFARIRRRLKA
jgi:prevent-host-death family protein